MYFSKLGACPFPTAAHRARVRTAGRTVPSWYSYCICRKASETAKTARGVSSRPRKCVQNSARAGAVGGTSAQDALLL